MTNTYRIEYQRERCIGEAICSALDPEQWFMDKDRKASPRSMELAEEQLENEKIIESLCPVKIIRIRRLEE